MAILPKILNSNSTKLVARFYVDHDDLDASDVTNSVNLYVIPPKTIIRSVKINHFTAFTGGAVSAYTVAVGVLGSLEKYASRFDVYQAVSGSTFQLSYGCDTISHSEWSQLLLSAWSVGADLDQVTQGDLVITLDLDIL